MKITLHQSHHQVADLASQWAYLKIILEKGIDSLHLFPELFFGGYPLQDLCLSKDFVESYQERLEEMDKCAKSMAKNDQQLLLFGGLKYSIRKGESLPHRIENVIYSLQAGLGLQKVYSKRLLPNYDIFDEKKYFEEGKEAGMIDFLGKKIGLLICEDIWISSFHDLDPVFDLKKLGALDLCVNLSASPYNLGKLVNRHQRGIEVSQDLKCPFVYVNKTGLEDEILFDGRSFVCHGNKIILQMDLCQQQSHTLNFDDFDQGMDYQAAPKSEFSNTWESLFRPRLDMSAKLPVLEKSSPQDLDDLENILKFAIQDYAVKNGFSSFLVALSGGIDSALVLALAKLSLKEGQKLEALYMPGLYSRSISYELSKQMCENNDISFKNYPIKFIHSTIRREYKSSFSTDLAGLADENIQSRLRGSLLYSRSNQTGAMVLNTSNKSEIAVGYSTQYGDSVGAISVLGDLYKTEVYELAIHLNSKYPDLIPTGIIDRPPSAELREEQLDSDSLPEYPILDALIEATSSYHISSQELLEYGFKIEDIEKVTRLFVRSEFKRYQFCPIIKLKTKSFGFGHRVPTSKDYKFYRIFKNIKEN